MRDGACEQPISGRLGNGDIEVPVGEQNMHDGGIALRGPLRLAYLSQAIETGGIHAARCGELGRGRLQQEPHLIRLPDAAQSQRRDGCSALGRLVDQPLLHQPRKRRANGGHSQAITLGQGTFGCPLTGFQAKRQDIEPDELVGSVGEGQ
jgi:hypothetical protein